MMSIKEIKDLLDEGKIVVLYKDEDGYAVTEFPPRKSKGGGKKNIISDDNYRNTVVTTVPQPWNNCGNRFGTTVTTGMEQLCQKASCCLQYIAGIL